MTAEEKLLNEGYEDIIIFSGDSDDDALIGVYDDGRAIYDYDLMVEWLMVNDDMTDADAMEWIKDNTIRSLPYVGDKAPIVMHRLME